MSNSTTIGRFAPSPSGPLHLGSLMSATCSYLQAKSKQGQWFVRIEDVDTPRVVKGMADIQLKQLDDFGFKWDGQVLYQSTRFNAYEDIIQQLLSTEQIYACECTRKQLKETAQASQIGFIYPQTCLDKQLKVQSHSLRFITDHKDISFIDKVYHQQKFNIQNLSSDWVIKRVDGIYAYHLAVVIDDAYQGITEIVRGFDVLPLTPLHLDLQNRLNIKTPSYLHHPLIQKNGQKLSKQNHAEAINQQHKIKTLNFILKALGQDTIESDDLNSFWILAKKQWNQNLIPQIHYSL